MARLILLVVGALLMGCSAEETPPAFPYYSESGRRVRDLAGILSPQVEQSLTATLEQAETQWGQQMGIVTVDSLEGYTIEDFALYYARSWGLGDAKPSDGLLLLVAPNERRLRIEVGKGIEGTFTDTYCKEVIDRMTPYFSSGDFETGITVGVEELVANMREHPTIPANDNSSMPREKAA